jgi:pyruvate dehydrogenase E2 component (dihydrolipoamide acetyltransferase)
MSFVKPLCIITDEASDVAKFKLYKAEEKPSVPQKASKEPKIAEAVPPKPVETLDQAIPSSKQKELTPSPKEVLETGRIFASPLARKVAREKGVSLQTVQGTGPHGRITYADVETGVASISSQPSMMQPSTTGIYTDIPLSNMRKVYIYI